MTEHLTSSIRGAWNADTTYQLGVVVWHSGQAWASTVYNNLNSEPTGINTAWLQLSTGGGGGLPTGLTYVSPCLTVGTDADNQTEVCGSATGDPVSVTATGTDANVHLMLAPKGPAGSLLIPIDTSAGDCSSAVVIGDPALANGNILTNFTCGPLLMASNYLTSAVLFSAQDSTVESVPFANAIYMLRSGGTVTAPTPTLTGMPLGEVSFGGFGDSIGGVLFDSQAPVILAFATQDWDGSTPATVTGALVFGTGLGGHISTLEDRRFSVHNTNPFAINLGSGLWGLPTDYETAVVQWNANVAEIGAAAGGTGTLRPLRLIGASVELPTFSEVTEIVDPAAPAANKARLYARDNGAGKTQLVVRFPTGAVQVIATEP